MTLSALLVTFKLTSVVKEIKTIKTKSMLVASTLNVVLLWSDCLHPIGTASANSVESDLGSTSRIYFDNVSLTLHNMTLKSLKPCQHNNKCDCSKTNCYK